MAGKKFEVSFKSDICGSKKSTVIINVDPIITKVSVKAAKTVKNAAYPILSQEIDTVKEYPLTISDAKSNDKLSAEVAFNNGEKYNGKNVANYVRIESIDATTKKIKVIAGYQTPDETVAHVTIRNESIKGTDDKGIVVGEFDVTTTAPAWTKASPSASLAKINDVEMYINVAAPKNVGFTDGHYYFGVTLSKPDKTVLKDGLYVNTETQYVKLFDSNQIKLNAFLKDAANPSDPKALVTEYGEGCAAKLDAQVKLYLTVDGKKPEADGSNLITVTEPTKAKKLSVSTKAPYYCDKVTVKKAVTKLYPGQEKVKIADVNLGKNTTFYTRNYWQVEDIVNSAGTTMLDAFEIPDITDKYDTGVYLSMKKNNKLTPIGKYTVIVSSGYVPDPEDGGKEKKVFYCESASIDIEVLPTVKKFDEIRIGGIRCDDEATQSKATPKFFQKPNGDTVLPIQVVAIGSNNSILKNPKLEYEVGIADIHNPKNAYTKVWGLEVDKKGRIIIKKDSDVQPYRMYTLRVKPAYYGGEPTLSSKGDNCDRAAFYVCTDTADIKNITILKKVDGNWVPLAKGEKIPSDKLKVKFQIDEDHLPDEKYFFEVEEDQADYKISVKNSKNEDANQELYSLLTQKEMETLTSNRNACFSSTITATGNDGTSAKTKLEVGYQSDSDIFDRIGLKNATIESNENGIIAVKNISMAEGIEVYLTDEHNIRLNPDEDNVEGTISIDSGIKFYTGKYSINFIPTKEKTTVTLKKGKITKKWTIINKDFSKPKALKGKSVYTGTNEPIYKNYPYSALTEIYVEIAGDFPNAGDICKADYRIEGASSEITGNDAVFDYTNNRFVISLPYNAIFSANQLTVYIAAKDEGGVNITSSPLIATVKINAFKPSFTCDSTLIISNATQDPNDANRIIGSTKITGNGNGVASITTLPQYTYNVYTKGVYNHFTKYFTCHNDDDGAGEACVYVGMPKDGIDNADYTGYIGYTVYFVDGTHKFYIAKVTMKVE